MMSLSGCGTLGYLLQAGKGQLALINHAKPIPEVLKDEKVPPRTRKLLAEIDQMKRFGEEKGIKRTHNYIEYVALDRPVASWVVSACEPLRFKSKEWSFPIVGTFPYLGWFDLDGAKKLATELKHEGWDVDLRGAAAFSTLGWFRDAVLSSMIAQGDEALGDLVNVILHESVHATLYLKGQAYFNESIAVFVADKLTIEYLERFRGPQSVEKVSYVKSEEEGENRRKRLHETYEVLNQLYQSGALSSDEKLRKKGEILSAVKEELKFKRDINNATLIQFKTYHEGLGDFEAVYQACGRDWGRFWSAMRSVSQTSFTKTQQEDLASVLRPLAEKGCPQP